MNRSEIGKRIIRRLIEEVVNAGNVAPATDLVSPAYVETVAKVRIGGGATGMSKHVRAVRAIDPDHVVSIERQVAERMGRHGVHGAWHTFNSSKPAHSSRRLGDDRGTRPLDPQDAKSQGDFS